MVFNNLSELTLVLANLIPLLGVLFFGWDLQNILFLYWCESGVVGFFNIIKIPFVKVPVKGSLVTKIFLKLISIPFFISHFGGVMIGHMLFLMFLTNPNEYINQAGILKTLQPLWFGVVGLFLSHGISFIYNFFYRKEYIRVFLIELMAQPYYRVTIMQLALMLGAFLVILFNKPAFLLVLLVVLKILMDIRAHRKERLRFSRT